MRALLLDTHVVLWLLADDPRLGPSARRLITDATEVLVSAASMWEIEIKRSLGKLSAPAELAGSVADAGLRELPVTWEHTRAVASVELPHRDPFDAMLVAQARTERTTLLTADRVLLQALPTEVVDARG